VPRGGLDLEVGHIVVGLVAHHDGAERVEQLGLRDRADHGAGERQGLAGVSLAQEEHGGIAASRPLPGGVGHDLFGGALGTNGLLHGGPPLVCVVGFGCLCQISDLSV